MDRVQWAAWTDPEIVKRRAGGRKHYNAMRRLQRDLRRLEILERSPLLLTLLSKSGAQQRLAAALGVHLSTISRDVAAILAAYRPCPLCGHWMPRTRAFDLHDIHHQPRDGGPGAAG
ncbi:MAG TPA: hypothetical protein VFB73_07065 [Chloroflexota bacterium]|nr:hypothetical protein [Chloroflexota bacterium]